jgi:hypothetical protein
VVDVRSCNLSAMHPIVFPVNRTSFRIGAGFLFVTAAVGVYIIVLHAVASSLVIGAVWIAVYGGAGIAALRHSNAKFDVLTVTSHGFDLYGAGEISWFEVESMHITSISMGRRGATSRVIAIDLYEPETYLARAADSAARNARTNLVVQPGFVM